MAVELQTLGRAIKQAQHRHHRALETGLAAAGTTLAQWDALRAIDREPGASTHQLRRSDVHDGSGLRSARQTPRRSGPRGAPPGPRPLRLDHHLTPAGEATLDAGRTVADTIFATSFANLGATERRTLLELLDRVGPPAGV